MAHGSTLKIEKVINAKKKNSVKKSPFLKIYYDETNFNMNIIVNTLFLPLFSS